MNTIHSKNLSAVMCLALVACGTTSQARPAPAEVQSPPPAPAAPPPPPAAVVSAPPPAPADNGLNDLASMTFGCPKAALNAAAREAAKVQAEGTYQFAYFGIVSDSHHGAYEVHFKSNYQSEPLLKYCVSIYCQQGWDPKTSKTEVALIEEPAKPGTHNMCDAEHKQPPAAKKR